MFPSSSREFQRESQNLSYCLDSSLVCKWRPRYSLDTQPGDPASTTVYLQYVLQHKNQKTLRYPSHHRWRGPQIDHRILSTVLQYLFVPDSLERQINLMWRQSDVWNGSFHPTALNLHFKIVLPSRGKDHSDDYLMLQPILTPNP